MYASQNRLGVFGRFSEGATPPEIGAARRGAATNSDSARPSRPLHARCVSPNPFSIPSSLLYPLTVLRLVCLVRSVPHTLLYMSRANLMTHSQTLACGLASAKVVRDHRLAPVSTHEIPKPVREAVRIPLDRRFQPQNFACRGVSDHAHDRFFALHANHSLIRDCQVACPRARSASRARFAPLPDIPPRAHARYGDAEGGERTSRGAERQSERPRGRRPSAHPLGSGRLGRFPLWDGCRTPRLCVRRDFAAPSFRVRMKKYPQPDRDRGGRDEEDDGGENRVRYPKRERRD